MPLDVGDVEQATTEVTLPTKVVVGVTLLGFDIFGVEEKSGSDGFGDDLCAERRSKFSKGFGRDDLNLDVMSDKSCLFLISHRTGVDVTFVTLSLLTVVTSHSPFFDFLRHNESWSLPHSSAMTAGCSVLILSFF